MPCSYLLVPSLILGFVLLFLLTLHSLVVYVFANIPISSAILVADRPVSIIIFDISLRISSLYFVLLLAIGLLLYPMHMVSFPTVFFQCSTIFMNNNSFILKMKQVFYTILGSLIFSNNMTITIPIKEYVLKYVVVKLSKKLIGPLVLFTSYCIIL